MRASSYVGGALAATLLLGTGCDDSPSGPGPLVNGVRFQYSGARSGAFEARGTPTLQDDGSVNFGEWTAAQLDSLGGIVIASFRAGQSPEGDLFILQLGPAVVREWDELCGEGTQQNGDRCSGRLLIGLDAGTFSPNEYYEAISGSATITELTSTRVRGTFELVTRSNGGQGTQTITLSGGAFDAPILGGATGNAVACVIKRATSGETDPCSEGWDP